MINEILEEKIIRRDYYLNMIDSYTDSNVIKVITGMRRVGKSSILKLVIQELIIKGKFKKQNIFYINKENLKYDFIKDYRILYDEFNEFIKPLNKDEKIFIGIDEIQDIDGWEKFINSCLSQYGNKIEIFITGSNSTMLSGELATYITGRYIQIEIFPLDLNEYSIFSNRNIDKELFLEYLKYGGLPGLFSMKREDKIIFEYLNSIYSTIVLKDIVKYFGLRNIDFFENLYKHIFANIGNIVNAKNISDYLKSQKVKISTETVLNYLMYGIKVYVIDQVKSVDPNTKKYFEIYNKYYSLDLGIRNSLVGFDLKRDIGNLLENYVFLELKKYCYDIKIGKLSSGKEIDFVVEKFGVKKYFQVCYLLADKSTMDREYSSLEQINDNWEKYVVSMDEINFGINEGIKHISFLSLSDYL